MKWVEKPLQPLKGEIIVCACGNKYLKTRDQQIVCVRCMMKERDALR